MTVYLKSESVVLDSAILCPQASRSCKPYQSPASPSIFVIAAWWHRRVLYQQLISKFYGATKSLAIIILNQHINWLPTIAGLATDAIVTKRGIGRAISTVSCG